MLRLLCLISLLCNFCQSFHVIEKVYDSIDCSGNVSIIISALMYEDCASQVSTCKTQTYEDGTQISYEKICTEQISGADIAKAIFPSTDSDNSYAGFAYYTDLGCRTERAAQFVRSDGKCHTTNKYTSYKFSTDSRQYIQYAGPNCLSTESLILPDTHPNVCQSTFTTIKKFIVSKPNPSNDMNKFYQTLPLNALTFFLLLWTFYARLTE